MLRYPAANDGSRGHHDGEAPVTIPHAAAGRRPRRPITGGYGAVGDRRRHGARARAAVALDVAARAAIEPFYRAAILADREAVRKAEGRQPRRWSGRLRARYFEDGVAVATRCDPVVFRAFVRMFNMLETPERAFGNPRVLWRSLKVMLRGARRNQMYQLPDPPEREATIARCEAAVA